MGFSKGGITGRQEARNSKHSIRNETIMAKNKASESVGETPTLLELVTVRVIGQRVSEDGNGYAKGETFQTTAERADALAGLVEIVTDAAPAEPV